MATLRANPFNMTLNSLLVARIKAANAFGYQNNYSNLNTDGARIKTEP